MIAPAHALQFSMWLAATHPRAFRAVWMGVAPPRVIAQRNRFGGPVMQGTYIPKAVRSAQRAHPGMPPFARGQFGSTGALGDEVPISPDEVTVEASAIDVSPVDTSAIANDPTLADININTADIGQANIDLSGAAAATDNSGGFWSSIGAGLSSVGSGLASAVGSVAAAVTNPQTLKTAGQIASTVIASNAQAQAAQMQQAVLQAQLQRTVTGIGAAPIRYSINPATQQRQPYYYNAQTGQYQLATPQSLLPTASAFAPYLPFVLLGGGLLVVVLFLRK
jgi:hypothetical protein